MTHRTFAILALVTAVAAGPGAAGAADKLSLVHPFPDFLVYTKSCKAMVETINKAAGDVLQIDVRGGPEAIKMFQQAPAVRDGIVDLSCVPAAFYASTVPENEAISTSNASPAHVRANGGMAIMDELHQKYFKTKYLGWIDSGPSFHIYTAEPPRFKNDGLPDLDGVKLRDNPIYGAFFRALGATTHNMAATEVYSALEKGTVNASAWTSIGLMDLKWDKFLRHRIDPKFYQTDIGVIINLSSWNKLGSEAKDILRKAVIEHEESSRAARLADVEREEKILKDAGMKMWPIEGEGASRYLRIAVDSAYDRMESRLEEKGRSLEFAKKLRTLYQR